MRKAGAGSCAGLSVSRLDDNDGCVDLAQRHRVHIAPEVTNAKHTTMKHTSKNIRLGDGSKDQTARRWHAYMAEDEDGKGGIGVSCLPSPC